jgi:hypothetical protein
MDFVNFAKDRRLHGDSHSLLDDLTPTRLQAEGIGIPTAVVVEASPDYFPRVAQLRTHPTRLLIRHQPRLSPRVLGVVRPGHLAERRTLTISRGVRPTYVVRLGGVGLQLRSGRLGNCSPRLPRTSKPTASALVLVMAA